ncbi:MAG: NAD(P)/FAD-dependent oxidoreductase [Chloroflexota bacterium]|nr:MAG: FAD-dependent oxidoreductase [Chloroflexota bacterium]
MADYDAIVVGAGPNGLAAAIELARAGKSVLVCEAKDTIGGGSRTKELTLPGYLHDVCSAIHPMGVASPFFKSLPLADFGLEWIQPELPLAHPFDDGTAAFLHQSITLTGESLDPGDAKPYSDLMWPFVRRYDDLLADILGPLPLPPRHPFLLARFGLVALPPATWLANRLFKGPRAKALFAGMAAHSFLSLDRMVSSSFGLVLGILGHAVGWPIPKGGSQSIVNAMAAYLETLGGKITTGMYVRSLDDLPPARVVLFDVTPKQLVQIAGDRLPAGYRSRLEKYRYGPGVFKLDWALAGPIPWKAPECRRAGTVHLGATLEEIALSERLTWQGKPQDRPFTLIAQQSLFDPTRAPEGRHTGWAYCHVAHGSTVDMTEAIIRQVERFAPGFRDLIIETHAMTTEDIQAYNPNYIGGDINGGVQDIGQLFTRPTIRLNPYKTPAKGIYLCSSSTPPGGAVHGMCGYHAARAALRDLW